MKKSDFLSPSPEGYKWPQCPEAERFVQGRLAEFLAGHSFAEKLSKLMLDATGTEFQMWVDHLTVPKTNLNETMLKKVGYVKDKSGAYWHPFADLPRVILAPEKSPTCCAIMVDSISEFLLAHNFSVDIAGSPYSLYREARIPGERGELKIIERRGSKTLKPDTKDRAANYLRAVELWLNRKRDFRLPADGMKHALKIAQQMVKLIGQDMAAWAFLEAERRYWESRNRTAQVQKSRQDKLGLGWANHDHHTFRSSRPNFPMLMKIFLTFGFKKRERYYAGSEAGWGAQVMEQPEARLIIFADVDLTPEEVSVDFASVALPELKRPGTIGLWCGLHGDSILESGMHHLEAKFDFDMLRNGLHYMGVNFMKPFSDFPHLRQAFSEGEIWRVPIERLESLRSSGKLSEEAYAQIKQKGAVGSHLENLQRRDGFKGFNQRSVSDIIREVNPESQALRKPEGAA